VLFPQPLRKNPLKRDKLKCISLLYRMLLSQMKTKKSNLQVCCLCGPSAGTRRKNLEEPYFLWKCNLCNLVQLFPKPTEKQLAEIYSIDYFRSPDSGYRDYNSQEVSLRNTYKAMLKKYEMDLVDKSVLDVGSGPGYFLKLAKESGARSLFAIEPAIQVHSQLRTMNIEILGENIGNVKVAAPLDLISCFQTLEHIPDPVDFLKKMFDFLDHDGLLVISVPNYNSWLRMFLGKKWPSYKVPEHLTYFNKDTLGLTLKKAGLSHFTIAKMEHYFPFSILQENGIAILPNRLASKLFRLRSTSLIALVTKGD
jgi:2-polyprenyl-3-methyl-5-hydroxy-6-metoxy-1,4-benzoquinol methylase